MQSALNQRGISSYVEMIWPLPGETLTSFQDGLAKLCDLGADCFLVYPLVLMNNVELCDKQDEFGLKTVRDPDPNSEAEIVVQTNEVSAEAFEEGARYVYAVTALYTLRGLWTLGRYLHSTGRMDYGTLFKKFVDFWRAAPANPFSTFCEESIRTMEHVQFSNAGGLIHLTLHAERAWFDGFLAEFVRAQDFWQDPIAQFCFEVDLINRPYIYRNTPIAAKRHDFAHLKVNAVQADGYEVEIPREYATSLREYLAVEQDDLTSRFEVNHRRAQLPYMPRKSLHEHYIYCQDMAHRIRKLVPAWRDVTPVVTASLAVDGLTSGR
jgi:hypothetical protein